MYYHYYYIIFITVIINIFIRNNSIAVNIYHFLLLFLFYAKDLNIFSQYKKKRNIWLRIVEMFYTYIEFPIQWSAINRLFNLNFPFVSTAIANVSLSRYFTIAFALKSNLSLSNTIHMHVLSIRLLPSESNLSSIVQHIACFKETFVSRRSTLSSLSRGRNRIHSMKPELPEIILLNRAAFNEWGGSEKKKTRKHATTGNYIWRETSFEKYVSLSLSRECFVKEVAREKYPALFRDQ